jgi:hypothetical protein
MEETFKPLSSGLSAEMAKAKATSELRLSKKPGLVTEL